MKKLLLFGLIAALAGCGSVVKKDEAVVRARDATMESAAKKIIVTRETTVDGHPKFAELGPVQGRCGNDPTGQETFPDDNLREAAYRKYGDQVNAITNAYGWFVLGNAASEVSEPGSSQGHFECSGTAIHFAEAASASK